MRTDLIHVAGRHESGDGLPVLAVQAEAFEKARVLLQRPSALALRAVRAAADQPPQRTDGVFARGILILLGQQVYLQPARSINL